MVITKFTLLYVIKFDNNLTYHEARQKHEIGQTA